MGTNGLTFLFDGNVLNQIAVMVEQLWNIVTSTELYRQVKYSVVCKLYPNKAVKKNCSISDVQSNTWSKIGSVHIFKINIE